MLNKVKSVDECEEFERKLDLDTKFSFPQVLSEHNILDKHLVIAPEQANWLVCDDEEYAAFQLFKAGKSFQEVEKLLVRRRQIDADQAREIVSRLVAQILGKEFLKSAAVSEKDVFKTATLRITAGCNLRCSICWQYATVPEPNECSYDDWRKFLDAFSDVGGETVTLSGGEPMTSPDCIRIAQYAKRIGLKVILLTNATLVSKENARALTECCGEIQVSIDGPDAETHDSVRGKGMFERTMAGLIELSRYPNYHLSVGMTPTHVTLPSFNMNLRQFMDWIHQTIDPDISFRVTRNLWAGRHIPTMTAEEEAAHQKNVIAMCEDQFGAGFSDKLNAYAVVPNRRVTGCGLAVLFTVDPGGDMNACIYLSHPFGNIKDIGKDANFFRDIAHKIKQMANLVRVEELPVCQECDLRYFCGGKCRKKNERDNGCPKNCDCDSGWKASWYERLIRISPYIVQPIATP